MNITRLTRMVAVTATVFSLAGPMGAAQVTFSATAPTPGTNDIVNLTGATTEMDNASNGDHDAIYIADDRPVQGQTFTTGTNTAGYQLRAVTLREVKHYTYALVPDLKYTLRVTKPSDKTLEVIKTETAEAVATASGNFPSIGDGAEMGRVPARSSHLRSADPFRSSRTPPMGLMSARAAFAITGRRMERSRMLTAAAKPTPAVLQA